MKQYFYSDNDKQFGPFTLDELKEKRLKKSTLVWMEGLDDWKNANEIEELKSYLTAEPPPLPKKDLSKVENEIIKQKIQLPTTETKYDNSYEKETDATIIGLILFILPIFINLSGLKFNLSETQNGTLLWVFIIGLLIRIGSIAWVMKIAKRQNRNYELWGLIAFFFPSIALIIIGQLKKLKLVIRLKSNLSSKEQISALLTKATDFFEDNRYDDCILVLDKLSELDNQNIESLKIMGITNYKLNQYEKSKECFNKLLVKEAFLETVYYYLGNIAFTQKNKEVAVQNWFKAGELNNENANKKLDLFHTYTHQYLLDKSIVLKKINTTSNNEFKYSMNNCKYLGGIEEVDKVEKILSCVTEINGYDEGLHIQLRKTFKTFNIGVGIYEIDNIILKREEKILELHLTDNTIIKFKFDNKLGTNRNSLNSLLTSFVKSSNKEIDINSYLKE